MPSITQNLRIKCLATILPHLEKLNLCLQHQFYTLWLKWITKEDLMNFFKNTFCLLSLSQGYYLCYQFIWADFFTLYFLDAHILIFQKISKSKQKIFMISDSKILCIINKNLPWNSSVLRAFLNGFRLRLQYSLTMQIFVRGWSLNYSYSMHTI